jgi:hypothetical protein
MPVPWPSAAKRSLAAQRGGCQQAQRPGAGNGLGPAVHAQLGVQVTEVGADGAVRDVQLAGDLRRRQVGGQVAQMLRMFPDMHVYSDPYPIQFGGGDWITVVTRATGTFTGEMALPDGTVIPPTGKAFDVEFGQTTKWHGDQLIVISAFWDAAPQRQQLGLT